MLELLHLLLCLFLRPPLLLSSACCFALRPGCLSGPPSLVALSSFVSRLLARWCARWLAGPSPHRRRPLLRRLLAAVSAAKFKAPTPHLRRPLPRRGRWNGARGLHRTGIRGDDDGNSAWRRGFLRPQGPCLGTCLDLSPPTQHDCEYGQTGTSVEQAASPGDFAGKPLVVPTAGVGSDADWSAKQDALATLSTENLDRVIKGAGHAGLITDQKGAAATTQAIRDVATSVRTAQPLAS